MAKERRRTIELPWEGRGPRFGAFGRGGFVRILGAALVVAFVFFVLAREERVAGVRATRGRIASVHAQLANFRADHPGMCPQNWTTLVSTGYLRGVPVDAWGRALRLRCPGRTDPAGMDVVSDGPDGELGGLDRVE